MIIARRAVFRRFAALLGLSAIDRIPKDANAQDQQQNVRFMFKASDAHFESLQRDLVFESQVKQERNTKGVPLLYVFAGIIALPVLVDAVLKLRRRLVQQGIRIDARLSPIVVEVDPSLPKGYILLTDVQGSKLYEPEEVSSPSELVKAFILPKAR